MLQTKEPKGYSLQGATGLQIRKPYDYNPNIVYKYIYIGLYPTEPEGYKPKSLRAVTYREP